MCSRYQPRTSLELMVGIDKMVAVDTMVAYRGGNLRDCTSYSNRSIGDVEGEVLAGISPSETKAMTTQVA